MTDTTPAEDKQLSSAERWLAMLGIRPEDKVVTGLLFSNIFLFGIAISVIRVCALTLFLREYSSEQLALIAILLALIGMPVTVIIDRLTHRFSLRAYIFTILGTIAGALILLRFALGITDSRIIIFTLPLFFEVIYMLFNLQFIAQLTRLLNVRQAKRLSGVARSGEFFAEMVGGVMTVLLLKVIGIPDLLIVAVFATFAVAAIAALTAKIYSQNLLVTNEDIVEEEISDSRLLGMIKLPYVRLIVAAYATYMFAYFFLDVAFYHYASVQYPDEQKLASFIAEFFAATGFFTMLAMVFLFAPFLRRLGIIGGVVTFPALILAGSLTVSSMEFAGVEVGIIFIVMVVTNGIRYILQSAIWRPSVTILFQVLPDRQRVTGTSLIEGIVDPVAGGVAGLCLYVLTNTLGWNPKEFLLVLAVLMVVWLILAVFIRRHYLSNLVVSIQKRKLGELALKELDNSSLEVIKTGIRSEFPAEIFYCLNLLEEIEHPEITELLKEVLPNSDRDVRLDVLRRVANMDIRPLIPQIKDRIEKEEDPTVRGQALITYAVLEAPDAVEVVGPFLDSFHPDLRRGALVAILTFDQNNEIANNYLLDAVRSKSPDDRLFAAKVLGDIGSPHFSGFLVELLDDTNTDVIERAIFATGLIEDTRLINILVSMLNNPTLLPAASTALRHFGEAALYDLDLGFTSPEATRQVKLQTIEIVRDIGGVKAIELLLRYIDIDQPELLHQIYLGLAALHYQADPDDQYVFVNKLDEQVHSITWLMAAMEDIRGVEQYNLLHSALSYELDIRRDNLLLLTSFLFPSIVMLDTRANIDSKVAELRIFALEVLDNLLTGEIKQIVLPLLDDLTVAERLAILGEKFPQKQLSPEERFADIVAVHSAQAFYWTRSIILYLIGEQRHADQSELVEKSLNDKEPIIRETSLWSISRLDPPNLRRTLQSHVDDRNHLVKKMAEDLLTGLPEPDPT